MTKFRFLVVAYALALAACSTGSVFSLEMGSCFNDQVAEEVFDVPIVECSEPHDNEVYLLIDYTESDTFPGDAAMESWTIDRCLEAFEPFVGVTYESSELDAGYLYPTTESWDNGDRESVCFVYELDLSLVTGSLRGVAR